MHYGGVGIATPGVWCYEHPRAVKTNVVPICSSSPRIFSLHLMFTSTYLLVANMLFCEQHVKAPWFKYDFYDFLRQVSVLNNYIRETVYYTKHWRGVKKNDTSSLTVRGQFKLSK